MTTNVEHGSDVGSDESSHGTTHSHTMSGSYSALPTPSSATPPAGPEAAASGSSPPSAEQDSAKTRKCALDFAYGVKSTLSNQLRTSLVFLYHLDPTGTCRIQPWYLTTSMSSNCDLRPLDSYPRVTTSSAPHFAFALDSSKRTRYGNPELPTSHVHHNTELPRARVAPSSSIPFEVFDNIMRSLTREDVKQMRLVNRDWERKVASFIFRSVVVPVNKNICGKLGRHADSGSSVSSQARVLSTKAQGKQPQLQTSYQSQVPSMNDASNLSSRPCQLLETFGRIGPYIRRFGISFDVSERSLLGAPDKPLHCALGTCWGDYAWPSQDYERYANRAGLENTADEKSPMTAAFAKLTNLSRLGLAINNGLGHLSGPDMSVRAHILGTVPPVFNSARFQTPQNVTDKRRLWRSIEKLFRRHGVSRDLQRLVTFRIGNHSDRRVMLELKDCRYGIPWYTVDARLVTHSPKHDQFLDINHKETTELADDAIPEYGLLVLHRPQLLTEAMGWTIQQFMGVSQHLRGGQLPIQRQELFLEAAWAQEAFLSSYMMSVIDNNSIFDNLRHFVISHLSSKYLTSISRHDFWASLPHLCELEIQVAADRCEVIKDNIRPARTLNIVASTAVALFHTFLSLTVAPKRSIKHVTIGWSEGGEHEEGITIRNSQILPVPLVPLDSLTKVTEENHCEMLELPHIEKITFKNCWLPPNVLSAFLMHHVELNLEEVILDSLSLTSHPCCGSSEGSANDPLVDAQLNTDLCAYAVSQQPGINNAPIHLTTAGEEIFRTGPNRPASTTRFAAFTYRPLPTYTGPLLRAPRDRRSRDERVGSWPQLLRALDTHLFKNAQRVAKSSNYAGAAVQSIKSGKTLVMKLYSVGYADVMKDDWIQLSTYLPFSLVSDDVFFMLRRDALAELEMFRRDPWFARIISGMPDGEMTSLLQTWPGLLNPGWPSPDMLGIGNGVDNEQVRWGRWGEETKKAALHDGFPRGGTGRFSGRVVLGLRAHEDKSTQSRE